MNTETIVKTDVITRNVYIDSNAVDALLRKEAGAPDNVKIRWKGLAAVLSWEIEKATLLAEEEEPKPEPVYDSTHKVFPVATGDVQVGDLVMVIEDGLRPFGPFVLRGVSSSGCRIRHHFDGICPLVGARVRHLTDEERAQIQRI